MASGSHRQPRWLGMPPEILLEIVQYLNKGELKSVRLASRSAGPGVCELLFDTVYISGHMLDNDIFHELAMHPHLSGCVQQLKYDTSQFATGMTKRWYFSLLSYQLASIYKSPEVGHRHSSDPAISGLVALVNVEEHGEFADEQAWHEYGNSSFVEDGYQRFLEGADQQAAPNHQSNYWKNITANIDKFPNLKSAEMYAEWYSVSTRGIEHQDLSPCGQFSLVGSPFKRFWNRNHLHPLRGSNDLRPIPGASEELCMISPAPADGVEEFAIMKGFLTKAKTSLKECEMIRRQLPSSIFNAKSADSPDPVLGPFEAFAHMEVLTLDLCPENWDFDFDPRHCAMPDLPKLLRVTSGLKRLRLDLISTGGDGEYYKLEDILPLDTRGWLSLESLTIARISTNITFLIMLLALKMPNLRSFTIIEIKLTDGSWPEMMECMRNYLNLAEFHIHPDEGLAYPQGGICWTKDNLCVDRDADETLGTWDEHETFYKDMERYVTGGGRHPCLRQDQADDAFRSASDNYYSFARSLSEKTL